MWKSQLKSEYLKVLQTCPEHISICDLILQKQNSKCINDLLKETDTKLRIDTDLKWNLLEADINFDQTYKYKNGEKVYQKNGKGRLPGYPDRILYKNLETPTKYKFFKVQPKESDHKPIHAYFKDWDLNVITMNAAHKDFHNTEFKRFLKKVRSLKSTNTILLCQELTHKSFATIKKKLQKYDWYCFQACGSIFTGYILGMFIKCSHENSIQHPSKCIKLYNNIKQQIIQSKGIQIAKMFDSKNKEILRIINLHAPFKNYQTTRKFMEKLQMYFPIDESQPLIVGGDFNFRSTMNKEQRNFTKNADYDPSTCGDTKRL